MCIYIYRERDIYIYIYVYIYREREREIIMFKDLCCYYCFISPSLSTCFSASRGPLAAYDSLAACGCAASDN